MKTAELVNLILDKLRTGRVEFIRIDNDFDSDFNVIEFKYGGNDYRAVTDSEEIIVTRITGNLVVDSYSQWVEGVLNGKTRDEAGVLS